MHTFKQSKAKEHMLGNIKVVYYSVKTKKTVWGGLLQCLLHVWNCNISFAKNF